MIYRALLISTIALLALLVAPGAAEADRYRVYPRPQTSIGLLLSPHGLYVGAGLVGASVLHRDGDTLLGNGGGGSLYSGIRFHRALGLELGWIGTAHETASGSVRTIDRRTWLMNGFTADARIYLPASQEVWEPYLQGGFGVYVLDDEGYAEPTVGTGFQAGGGFDARLGRHLRAGLRVLYRGLSLGPASSDELDSYVGLITAEGTLSLRF